MSLLVLIRPGCTDFDDQHRIQGTIDLPLNAVGVHQMNKTLAELKGLPLDVVYTSPNDPAKSAAAMVAWEFGLPLKELAGLNNINQGLWQGLQLEELRRKQPTLYRQWHDAADAVCPPGGELYGDARERVRKTLQKPLKRSVSAAIVACEPIATLIREVVMGTVPETNPVCEPGHHPRWEVLRTNGYVPQTLSAPARTEAVIAPSVTAPSVTAPSVTDTPVRRPTT
jgi:probable phosphoglycerate mutase